MTWVVCGAPRSGTSAMVDLLVRWTNLPALWDLAIEAESQRESPGANPRYFEVGPSDAVSAHGHIVKVLNPALPITPRRVVLMKRDPAEVCISARKLDQLIYPDDVTERWRQFVEKWPDRTDVWVDELPDEPSLAVKLAAAGWPVMAHPCSLVTVKGAR